MSQSQSQQQNPPPTHQTGSEADDVKPFSIRQYVLASRHRSIFSSWPFPDKYLQMCLNHGLRDVLPPFGFQTSSLAESSLKGGSNLNMRSQNDDSKEAEFCKTEMQQHVIEHSQNSIKNECHVLMSHEERYKVTNKHSEEGNQHNCNASVNLSESTDTFTVLPSSVQVVHNKSCPSMAPSISKAMKDKRGRRKGRCKKRSMVDILAEARHCTLEEIYMMNKFFYAEAVTEENEACKQMLPPFENISKSENSPSKGASEEDHEAANNIDMTGKGTLLLKFKFNGCNVNWNI